MRKLAIAGILLLIIVFAAGCRTGEYPFDLEIYEAMPGLLAANEELAAGIKHNEDGSLAVTFEKGEMFLLMAYGLDPNTQQKVVSEALQIFHDQYVNNPDAKKKDGTFRRESIRIRGLVDEVELYVIRWDLADEQPDLESDRQASYY